jgi:hypothetical protein
VGTAYQIALFAAFGYYMGDWSGAAFMTGMWFVFLGIRTGLAWLLKPRPR